MKENRRLVERLKAGESKAFKEFVSIYETKIYNLALRILRNSQDAEDVLQEVFLSVFKSISKFDGRSNLSTWIYKIVTNASLMKLRKDKRKNSFEVELEVNNEDLHKKTGNWVTNPIKKLLNKELLTVTDHAIEELDPIYRTVFVLRDLEGLSAKESGEILNLTIPAIKSRLRRARVFLRNRIDAYFESERIGNEM